MLRWKYSRPLLGILIAAIAAGPLLSFGMLREPGIQQTLAVAFLYGALALTYDLLFGFTGLLSFGHALFFAAGAYLTAIFINTNGWSLYVAVIAAVAITALLAVLIGAASLRTKGITFAMVTLAFGEAGHVVISRNFGNLTNGENGLPINATLSLPPAWQAWWARPCSWSVAMPHLDMRRQTPRSPCSSW
jgi:branched-chain amino acid transport system permease protein